MRKISSQYWRAGAVILSMMTALPAIAENLPPIVDRSGLGGPSIEERLSQIERKLQNQSALVDMQLRLDSVTEDSQDLRGSVETLQHDLDGMSNRQRDLYLDMDRRVREAEEAIKTLKMALEAAQQQSAMGAPGMVGGTPSLATATGIGLTGSMATTGVAPTQAAGDPAKERETYQAAFNTLKEGRYEEAIGEFENFLALYPAGEYADNAQYWLGEANYVTRRFKVAEQEFRKVLEQFPDSKKVADAMLKLGYTYYELADWESARNMLSNVVTRFANTTVARLAESRLQKMRLEGR